MKIQMLTGYASTMEMEEISDIVNRVYKEAEKGIWSDGQVRTEASELRSLAEKGELAVARSDREIVGCVRLTRINPDTGEFGILAVRQSQQGTGVGRELVHFAEKRMQDAHVPSMQIKLLVPRVGMDAYPTKVSLYNWYVRLGYEKVGTEMIERQEDSSYASDERHVQIDINLAIPCQFIVFRKKLS